MSKNIHTPDKTMATNISFMHEKIQKHNQLNAKEGNIKSYSLYFITKSLITEEKSTTPLTFTLV